MSRLTLGAHVDSSSTDAEGFLASGKACFSVKLPDHLHFVPRTRGELLPCPRAQIYSMFTFTDWLRFVSSGGISCIEINSCIFHKVRYFYFKLK
jgi:hypothetical protein